LLPLLWTVGVAAVAAAATRIPSPGCPEVAATPAAFRTVVVTVNPSLFNKRLRIRISSSATIVRRMIVAGCDAIIVAVASPAAAICSIMASICSLSQGLSVSVSSL
jgi:hypothetical protein